MAINVMIADDHAIMRDGLRQLISTQQDMVVVGETDDGLEVINLARQCHPDIILMDVTLHNQTGIEAARAICTICPSIRVVILSMHLTAEHVYQALSAGAQSYLIKEVAGQQVLTAIRSTMAGHHYFCEQTTAVITSAFLASFHATPAKGSFDDLSPREREILQFVTAGQSSKEIAERLSLSPSTVDTYRSRIMTKLDVHDIGSLVRKCIDLGITPPPPSINES